MLYSAAQLEQLWTKAGGPAKVAATMAAVALAESGGNPSAQHRNTDGSVDRGLWQINSSHGYPAAKSFNPTDNAHQAVAVYRSQGLGAWSTYSSGAYRQFMPTTATGSGSRPSGGGGGGRSGVAFAQNASRYIGRPYVWGGSSPKGFDCSGLVFYVLTQMGLRGVPRTSEGQFPWTKRVSPAQLQVGDLVFLNFPGELSPGHVMIYLGGNQVLQAPGRGQNVGTAIFDPQKPGSNEWGATVVGYGRVPGLTYAGEPAGPLSMPSTLGASVPAGTSRPRPGADNSGLLDTIGSWFSGAAGAVAGTALDGVFPGLGEAVDEIGSPLDFLKLALWLLHPKTWLRAFEVLLGLAIIGLSLRGLFLIFASRDTPVDFQTVPGAARSLHERTVRPVADTLIPGNAGRRNQRRKRKSTATKAAGLATKFGEVPF